MAWHVSECPGAGHGVKWPRDARRRPYHRSGGTMSAACQAWSSTSRVSTQRPVCTDLRLRRAAPGSSPVARGCSGSGRPLRDPGARSNDSQTSSNQPGGAANTGLGAGLTSSPTPTIFGEPCLAGQRLMRQNLEGVHAHSSRRARWRSRPADGDRAAEIGDTRNLRARPSAWCRSDYCVPSKEGYLAAYQETKGHRQERTAGAQRARLVEEPAPPVTYGLCNSAGLGIRSRVLGNGSQPHGEVRTH